MADVAQLTKYIAIMLIVTVVDGVFTGYCFHEGMYDEMFIPLIIGFVLVFITYFLIEKRSELEAGCKVGKY